MLSAPVRQGGRIVSRAERTATGPDPGVLAGRLLIRPTARGLDQMRTADAIMADMPRVVLGAEDYARFKRMFADITEEQRALVAG